MRSGITSGNQFGMVAFENDIHDSWDFWKNDLRTYLPSFKNTGEEIE